LPQLAYVASVEALTAQRRGEHDVFHASHPSAFGCLPVTTQGAICGKLRRFSSDIVGS
jgi:hypothetical protein